MTKKEAIKIMERIQKYFLNVHYPLKDSMYDRENTVGKMFNKALKELKK